MKVAVISAPLSGAETTNNTTVKSYTQMNDSETLYLATVDNLQQPLLPFAKLDDEPKHKQRMQVVTGFFFTPQTIGELLDNMEGRRLGRLRTLQYRKMDQNDAERDCDN
jgi:hypothetical protein